MNTKSYISVSHYNSTKEEDIRNEIQKELNEQKEIKPEDIDKMRRVWEKV